MSRRRLSRRAKKGLAVALAAVLAALVFCAASGVVAYEYAFRRAGTGEGEDPQGTFLLCYGEAPVGTPKRRAVAFFSGKNLLRGHVYGEGNPKGLVVLSHGLGAGAEGYLAETLFFAASGWQVLAFDNTGSRSSEGGSTRGLSQSLPDLEAALGFAAADPALAGLPVVLYGHSWGGWAVAAVLDRGFGVAAAVSVSGFSTPGQALYDFATGKAGVFGAVGYPFMWAWHCLRFDAWANLSAVDAINNSGLPVMVIHGTGDATLRAGRSAILAKRGDITNPNAVFVVRDTPGQNSHTGLVRSADAAAYTLRLESELAALERRHRDGVLPTALRGFYAGVDRARASALDEALFEQINAFYEQAVGWTAEAAHTGLAA